MHTWGWYHFSHLALKKKVKCISQNYFLLSRCPPPLRQNRDNYPHHPPIPPSKVMPVLPFSSKYRLLLRSIRLLWLYTARENKSALQVRGKSMYMCCFHFLLTFPHGFLWIDVLPCSLGHTGQFLLVLPAQPLFYGKGTPTYKMSSSLLWNDFPLISLEEKCTATASLCAASFDIVFSVPTPC